MKRSTLNSTNTTVSEVTLWQEGYSRIAGVDEAGRGPLAGPVVAAVCVFEKGYIRTDVQDSKILSQQRREELYNLLKCDPKITWGYSVVDPAIIDSINILQASLLAMRQAIEKMTLSPEYVIIDGNKKIPHFDIPSIAIPKADATIASVSAASIIAKVIRDHIMDEYHQKFPQYGFNRHKGYGTKEHLDMLEKYGPCPIHRLTFEPLKSQRNHEPVQEQLNFF